MRREAVKIELELEGVGSVSGELIDMRLSKVDVADGLHVYEIRHSDTDITTPATVEKRVLVNFMGSFVTQQTIPQIETDERAFVKVLDWDYCASRDVAAVRQQLEELSAYSK